MMLRFLPRQAISKINKAEKDIYLKNGSIIRFRSADNPFALVGEGLDWLIIDESALVSREAWETALRPTLIDKEGKAIFISTPKGHNWFFEMFTRGQDKLQTEYESWNYHSSINKYLSANELEKAKNELPELIYRQEILAEFIEDVGSVFRGVDECIRNYQHPISYDPQHHYTMGVDLAKYIDFTVITIVNEQNQVVYFDRFQQLDWVFQKKKIQLVADMYKANAVIDSTGLGDPIFDDLSRAGMNVLSYKITTQSKKELIENLSLMIQQQKITFPEIPELIN
jgi:phage FluMu gp28-like protein